MTANPAKYRAPHVSQVLKEPDHVYDDCAASVALMIAADWTLGEWLIQPDGDQWDVLALRNLVRKRIGDKDGGLTLHDVDDILHELDPGLPPLPRYAGQDLKPGQTLPASATLRLDRGELKALLMGGYSAAICGYLPGSRVGHVIKAAYGNAEGPIVNDPMVARKPGWNGDRWTWERLWAFTERKVDGDRFGTPDAIACAVVQVGAETREARAQRGSLVAAAKANERLQAQKRQTALATEERDTARTEARLAQQAADELRAALTATDAALTECRNAQPPDCTAAVTEAVRVEHDRLVAIVEQEAADLVARIR